MYNLEAQNEWNMHYVLHIASAIHLPVAVVVIPLRLPSRMLALRIPSEASSPLLEYKDRELLFQS